MNVSLATAFIAGVASFLSPCVLPLVPGYLSIISGSSVEELKAGDRAMMRRVFFHSILFIIGFSIVFISLGASATWLGGILRAHLKLLMTIGGVLVILFGLHMTGLLRIGMLYRDARFHTSAAPQKKATSAAGTVLMGLAFAFGWTPCIGPILASILLVASTKQNILAGIILLGAYSLGLAVPFLLTSLGLTQFLSFYRGFRKHLHTVEVISGCVLIAIGLLLVTNQFTRLSGYLSFLNRFSI